MPRGALVAKLPARTKVVVVLFRRAGPDEVLVTEREGKRPVAWGLPFTETEEGEGPLEAARAVAAELVAAEPVAEFDLGVDAEFRVKAGPRAGEWSERCFALEVPAGARALVGRWLPHYEAKAEAGDSPRSREAITRLRERAKLKP